MESSLATEPPVGCEELEHVVAGQRGCHPVLAPGDLGRGPERVDDRFLSYASGFLRGYRGKVQMVFQDPMGSLNPRQTVYEAVAEGLRIQKLPGDEATRVADALSRAGLRPPERFFHLYPYELSGGQRQRVVIAGAMVLN